MECRGVCIIAVATAISIDTYLILYYATDGTIHIAQLAQVRGYYTH